MSHAVGLGLLDIRCVGATLVVNLGLKSDHVTLVEARKSCRISNFTLMEKDVFLLSLDFDKSELLTFWLTLDNACVHSDMSSLLPEYPSTIPHLRL